jgi:tetratricopeptide (TPR) repeat protein
MGVRELKEEALELYARRKYAQCANTYGKLLQMERGDPHLYVRHAEACRRAGERQKAIASYRAAAQLLASLGNEARARAALKAALELDPRDPEVALALERLTPSPAPRRQEAPRLALPMAPASRPTTGPCPAQVRWLSSHQLALRAAPGSRWLVVSSPAPLTACEVDDLERLAPEDFSLEIVEEVP